LVEWLVWVMENFHEGGDQPIIREGSVRSFNDVAHEVSRRDALKKLGVGALMGMMGQQFASGKEKGEGLGAGVTFEELQRVYDENLHVPDGYQTEVLLRWGDPIFPSVREFSIDNQSEDDQLKRFGYNNDFVGFIPFKEGSSDHGLLVVNHEYTCSHLMYPGSPRSWDLSQEQIDMDMAAHGMAVVEVKRDGGKWECVIESKYNRRITPKTAMEIAGPAAGLKRMVNQHSKDGRNTWGTFGNCAGGVTPWGTVLSGEENCQYYFTGNPKQSDESLHYWRMGVEGYFSDESGVYGDPPPYAWGRYDERFDIDKTPNGPLHSGWIVEIDPFDPNSVPKKRTALGRFRHEGCSVVINKDGRVVAYSGDDQKFEYIYKFVSKGKYNPSDRKANMDLLDDGTLYAAKFREDGRLEWLPLVFGYGPLTEGNGFHSQGDVCIDCRRAADLLHATPMDRPEDIEVNKATGVVYAMLTNNADRDRTSRNAVNPRENNSFGHIVEMHPPNGDHAATEFSWEFFILAGDPKRADHETQYHPNTSESGWFIAPDNCAFDNQGRIWIATDGGTKYGIADGVWVSETTGPGRALSKSFLSAPKHAELCGPFFTPDDSTLFCAVQHPGEKSSYEKPSTRWPDFDQNMPPRPAVVVVQKVGGGAIG